MLFRLYQWLLSLLPESWTEPIPATAGDTAGPTPTRTGDAAGDASDPPDTPPADTMNSRGARAVPLHGTEQPEPVKEYPTHEQEPTPQQEDTPPEIVIDLKPRRKGNGKDYRGR